MKKIIKKIIHYFLKKNNVVTLQDFKERVTELSNGDYHTVSVEISQFSGHSSTINYECYLNNFGHHNGATMDEAINKLKEAMKSPKITEVPTVII